MQYTSRPKSSQNFQAAGRDPHGRTGTAAGHAPPVYACALFSLCDGELADTFCTSTTAGRVGMAHAGRHGLGSLCPCGRNTLCLQMMMDFGSDPLVGSSVNRAIPRRGSVQPERSAPNPTPSGRPPCARRPEPGSRRRACAQCRCCMISPSPGAIFLLRCGAPGCCDQQPVRARDAELRVPVPMRQCPPCERLSSESQLAAQSIPVSAHEPPERRPALQSGIRYECNIIFWVFWHRPN